MENVSVVFVPRLTPVERPSSLLWSAVLRAVAGFALSCACCALFSFSCVVTSLCDSPDTHSPWLKKIALVMSSQFISLHMVAELLL